MAYWKLDYRGKTYSFDPNQDLTLRRLRAVKGWYKELGSFSAFNTALGQGDPDALACLIWICKQKAGEVNVREPMMMEDFAIGDDFYNNIVFVQDEDEDPTPPAKEPAASTVDTQPTLTNSEPPTSD